MVRGRGGGPMTGIWARGFPPSRAETTQPPRGGAGRGAAQLCQVSLKKKNKTTNGALSPFENMQFSMSLGLW